MTPFKLNLLLMFLAPFSFLISGNLFGQTYINDSLMDIHVNSGYASKHFVSKGKTKKDKKTGKWKEYAFNEFIHYKFEDGQPTGTREPVLTYGEGLYSDGKREGFWKLFLIDHETKKKYHCLDLFYINGKWEGEGIYYYPNGEIAASAFFINSQAEGASTIYYPDGSVERGLTYLIGDAEGECIVYYPSGKVKLKVNYCKGKACGIVVGYYESGEKSYEKHFEDGILDGLTIWYKNGTKKEVVNYKNGKTDGVYRYYYENGQLWVERVYDEGLLMEVNQLNDSDGNPLDSGDLDAGNGKVKYYTEAGKIYLIKTFSEGNEIEEVKY